MKISKYITEVIDYDETTAELLVWLTTGIECPPNQHVFQVRRFDNSSEVFDIFNLTLETFLVLTVTQGSGSIKYEFALATPEEIELFLKTYNESKDGIFDDIGDTAFLNSGDSE